MWMSAFIHDNRPRPTHTHTHSWHGAWPSGRWCNEGHDLLSAPSSSITRPTLSQQQGSAAFSFFFFFPGIRYRFHQHLQTTGAITDLDVPFKICTNKNIKILLWFQDLRRQQQTTVKSDLLILFSWNHSHTGCLDYRQIKASLTGQLWGPPQTHHSPTPPAFVLSYRTESSHWSSTAHASQPLSSSDSSSSSQNKF